MCRSTKDIGNLPLPSRKCYYTVSYIISSEMMDLFCFDSGGNLRKWVKLTLLNTRGYTLDLRKRHCLCQCFSLSLVGWRQAGKQEGMEVKRRKEEKEDRRNKRSGEGTWSLEWSVKKDPHSTLNDPSQSPGPMARTAEGEGVLWDSGGCPTITCSFVPLKGLTISHEYKNNQPFQTGMCFMGGFP